ncbi:hypothetical protein [Zunongwangia pacifica]|uniref:Uncharacterized protein n=1 Tax=Zunongwangia pacifica TaxID=2911062 RepID=A0A9X2CPT8_9FLAO|nr:hypothetical protein [Zunongwangia pacifica]MCL6218387.1 hypothetical protein [Zunongwangia pacifica]
MWFLSLKTVIPGVFLFLSLLTGIYLYFRPKNRLFPFTHHAILFFRFLLKRALTIFKDHSFLTPVSVLKLRRKTSNIDFIQPPNTLVINYTAFSFTKNKHNDDLF